MRKVYSFIGRTAPPLARDLFGIVGFGLFVYGIYQIHVPSAFIVAGLVMVVSAAITGIGKKPGNKADA